MDLSFRAIHDIVHPTSAYSTKRDETGYEGCGELEPPDGFEGHESVSEGESGVSEMSGSVDDKASNHCDGGDNDGADDEAGWGQSQLNPKNRIDSLAPLANPLWRIDGSAGLGTQFYVYPLFLANPPPMHIDVFIQECVAYPRTLRTLLDLDRAFHTKDAVRVRRLGIAQHILRILQRQTTHPDGQLHPPVVKELYRQGPLGSLLVLEDLACDIRAARIVVSPNYALENELLAYDELKALWGLTDPGQMPPEVDIHQVRLVRQLHDSICEVHVEERGRTDGSSSSSSSSNLVVLKSFTSRIKYMYQELRALLKDIPPHRHIIARPLHIVTKQCLFGSKTGVVGFTLPYHRTGSLRDILPLLRIHESLRLADQLRWARQLTEAMCHVWHEGHSYYPDLRLDNIVLSGPAPAGDIVLVDFEQRGVWCSFSAPEIDTLENIRLLACDDQEFGFAIPDRVCEKYRRKLVACFLAAQQPTADTKAEAAEAVVAEARSLKRDRDRWTATVGPLEDSIRYSNPASGYNVPWLCLTRREQEAAMVYMLGRVLWCIFEGMSAPHRGAIWQSYVREPELEFPAFRQTPAAVRRLIMRCFGAAGGQEPSKFVQQGSRLYMKEGIGGSGSNKHRLVSDNLVARARGYWRAQLKEGEAWLDERLRRLQQQGDTETEGTEGTGDTNGSSAFGRPTLKQVLRWLEDLKEQPSELLSG